MRQTGIKLGDKVADKITGFSGVVTGIGEYLTGCSTILVQPKIDKDRKWVDSKWFDETRLVGEGESVDTSQFQQATGPDKEAPRR